MPSTDLPDLAYQPQYPASYRPAIGVIGCGAIVSHHLTAYRAAGFHVVALCDVDLARAEERAREFYPSAQAYTDHRELLDRDDIEVVDIATHVEIRPAIVRDALRAGKHVLSQKPFVTDLDEGQELVSLADRQGVQLAVNQNGRWSPHFSYIRQAVAAGWLGSVSSVDTAVYWDHTWVQGTAFENLPHLMLYDFAIHWFDIVNCLFSFRAPDWVYASRATAPGQPIASPLLAQSLLQYQDGQAALLFNGYCPLRTEDRTVVVGSRGMVASQGPDLHQQAITLAVDEVTHQPKLEGSWFSDAFAGTMGELLCSIDEGRAPSNSGENNLSSLAICFAAVSSAATGQPVRPGTVRRLPPDESVASGGS